jgi:hypothetical protein
VDICNRRYPGSAEDRIHHRLAQRLESVSRLFGQLPDILGDVCVQVALGELVVGVTEEAPPVAKMKNDARAA